MASTSNQTSSLVRRVLDDARRRPANLRPTALPVPLRTLAVLTWLGAAVMLAFGFIPGVFDAEEYSLFGGELAFRYTAIWPLLCGIAVGSGIAAVGYLYSTTSESAPQHHSLLAWCAGIATPLIPVLILAIDRTWQTIPAAAAWLAAAALVVTVLHIRRRPPHPWLGVVLVCLVAAPWIPSIVANIRFGRALHTTEPVDPYELVAHLMANLGTTTYVPGIALAFIAAMATGGVALAAHSRAAVAHNVARRGWGVAAIVCVVAVAVIALEVSGLWGVSSGYLEGYWSLGEIGSWPHAVITAAAIVVVTQRSFRTPLRPRGDVATTLAVGVSALAVQILVAVVVIANLVSQAITGFTPSTITPPAGLELLIMWVALLAVVPVAVLPRFRGSVGRSVAVIALLYLVPVYVGVTALQLDLDVAFKFWAKASQVAICLTVIACIAMVLGILGKQKAVPAEMATRLALIPLLVISGTSWLPSVLATPLTPIIAVTAALYALLWTMPTAADNPNTHSGVVLTVSAQLLLVAAAAAIVNVYPDVSADDPTLALLFFGVPLSALLCANVRAQRLPDESNQF
ncbi:hypothetical protein A5757_21015 [Mycobacterium sp. 852013-51886_SCH5428379]|uniref:hypothetical protein n=1 Tax=Mycobacterium sp. 852013-51886_SCH5428379 TaxID=1834111 RepID=UPI0008007E0E|nr:hypothetical protein [Mycobacterium sp. 852013-51886_SCH5428379]OBB57115.1 hypothetical protein A5757_21015 [Mycobacterium sp. 852013-51886_SCH5428379]